MEDSLNHGAGVFPRIRCGIITAHLVREYSRTPRCGIISARHGAESFNFLIALVKRDRASSQGGAGAIAFSKASRYQDSG